MSISSNKGSATILTLLVSAVVITVGIGFNWIVREHLRAAEGLRMKTEAAVMARSAYEGLIYELVSAKMGAAGVEFTQGVGLPGIAALPLNGSPVTTADGATVRLQDSNGMLSLSNFEDRFFERLLRETGMLRASQSSVVADSLMDWVDQDGLTRVNGAEAAYYKGLNSPYHARNYPLQYKDELLFVRGMDSSLYNKISPLVTMLPTNGFNPNTASDEVLTAYLNIDRQTTAALRSYLIKKPITSDQELIKVAGRTIVTGEGAWFSPSRFVEVSVSSGSPRVLYRIQTGVDLRYLPMSPYSIVYWKED